LVKTTTPFCTQPEISICELSPGPVVNSSGTPLAFRRDGGLITQRARRSAATLGFGV
jgi:hypothetical protein